MLTARASKSLDLFYESFDRLISYKLILYIKGITQQPYSRVLRHRGTDERPSRSSGVNIQ